MPSKKKKSSPTKTGGKKAAIDPDSIKGTDDRGNFYSCHSELTAMQHLNKSSFYLSNDRFWSDGGYGGKTDDEMMVGDEGAIEDGDEGLAFLDRYLAGEGQRPISPFKPLPTHNAMDAGAGVGRLTKFILLKRYDAVRLVEADDALSKRSRTYLGHKRAGRCTFTCARVESLSFQESGSNRDKSGRSGAGGSGGNDLVWLQWTLQYLTDTDAVQALRSLSSSLVPGTGVMIVKENRPYGLARRDRFQMDTPKVSGRYDITRTDKHHRLLFDMAGLAVDLTEEGVETNTYALIVKK